MALVSSSPSQPFLVWKDSELIAVTYECLLVCRYPKGINLRVLEQSYEYGFKLAKKYPKRYCTMTLTELYPLPDEATRKRAAEQLAEISPLAKQGVVLLAGEGFAASTARAVLAGIQFLSRKKSHLVYAQDVREAVRILTASMSDALERTVEKEEVERALALVTA